jgi:ATP-dependent Clp endopeptidase proteolytic subunit ClpP
MKETHIKFMASVTAESTERLIRIVDEKIRNAYDKIHLLISSPGGSVFHGISIYNFLYGIPIDIATYNFGSVDSIGVVLFCAGKERYSVPHARFLIHGVKATFNGKIQLDEKMLEEYLKSVRIDRANIAKILAATTNKEQPEIEKDMHERITLNPNEAKNYGLVTEIKSVLVPKNSEFYSISDFSMTNPLSVNPVTPPSNPKVENYTYY